MRQPPVMSPQLPEPRARLWRPCEPSLRTQDCRQAGERSSLDPSDSPDRARRSGTWRPWPMSLGFAPHTVTGLPRCLPRTPYRSPHGPRLIAADVRSSPLTHHRYDQSSRVSFIRCRRLPATTTCCRCFFVAIEVERPDQMSTVVPPERRGSICAAIGGSAVMTWPVWTAPLRRQVQGCRLSARFSSRSVHAPRSPCRHAA
jgi:hypothetical protein